jgi:YggT family protein
MLIQISDLLLSTFFYLYILIVFLRLLFQLIRADFHNPLSQFILKATNPILMPMRRFIPAWGKIDTASLVLIIILKILELCLKDLFHFGGINSFYNIFAVSILELTRMLLNFYLFAIIVQIILSWLAPQNNNPIVGILYQITEPIMSPARRLVPPMGGLDLSPIIVILFIQVLELLLLHPSGVLPTFLTLFGRALGLL